MRQRPRRLRPSQRLRPPPPPAPVKPTPADIERAMERRLALQQATTAEVRCTAAAYSEVRAAQDVLGDPDVGLDVSRYRNRHDHAGVYDRLDRKQPVVMSVAHYAMHLVGFTKRTRIVPERAVAEYAEDDDGRYALVECPCGSKPVARAAIEKCASCERHYLLQGDRVLVLYGDMAPPGAEPLEAEATTCAAGRCDGSGLLVDEATNTAFDCECRANLIAEAAARAALRVAERS